MSPNLSLGLDCPICGGRCCYAAFQPDGERIRAIAITTPTADARAEALRLQHAWFKAPDDVGARHSFALALARWARLAHKPTAIGHAEQLLSPDWQAPS